ncbi:hypothetical protein ACFLZY_02130 [Patescibacteria group bacterium]
MTNLLQIIIIFFHTFVAWIGIEVYFNYFHSLPRIIFVALHYVVVFALFAVVFAVHARFFPVFSVFHTTLVALLSLLVIEFVVFTYFYSGELWFLNYVDWFVPVFLVVSAVYLAGTYVRA